MTRWIAVWITAIAALLGGSDALALGIGPYFALDRGSVEWDEPGGPVFDGDHSESGIGVVIDTNTATPRLFAYRFQFAVQRVDSKDERNLFELNGFRITNSFAFKLLAQEKARLWWAPQLRIGYLNGDYYAGGNQAGADLYDFGTGLAFGANLHTSATVSISTELGYRYSWFDGDVAELNAKGKGGQLFFSFSLLHRRGNDWFGGF